jgi:hypothetical protein
MKEPCFPGRELIVAIINPDDVVVCLSYLLDWSCRSYVLRK